ncbi:MULTISPECIES: pyridoxamine 5'-phosphate oxidase family protein [unclassified Clostridium]|uniref:pyridoxamine 5'-phosphate oxidase family protein n=1 Tax=unclassified Clostridium TaxID=2614128 RepID=UPI000297FC56|nr:MULTISPECIES: pyridoxamine 5'-phosphate oxidase family protein [unclassified Clostridium]EKQ53518.1 MAG: putative stress protein (general stress protein 26) [Clostridium sp. Maddingley MBC34-26]
MDFLKEFEKTMENTATFALATSVKDIPNVRIITFYYDNQNNNVIYFPTFKQSPKTMEISQNNKVAFTTIPDGTVGIVRVKNATIKKSDLTVYDIKDGITKKYPNFATTVEKAGAMMEVYEVHFEEAEITVNYGNVGKLTF